MRSTLRIAKGTLNEARADLVRPHHFAAERVGFFRCRYGWADDAGRALVALVHDYHAVADEDYIDDPRYGALIGSGAFRKAMQLAFSSDVGILHVHLHAHRGRPKPSGIDLRETKAFVPDFFNVRPRLPHGALILSNDSASGRLWDPADRQPYKIARIVIVGAPIEEIS